MRGDGEAPSDDASVSVFSVVIDTLEDGGG